MDFKRADVFFVEYERFAVEATRLQEGDYENYYRRPEWIEKDAALLARLSTAQALADAILPGSGDKLGPNNRPYTNKWRRAYETCLEIRGTIEHRGELEAILGPTGPKLSASNLHHWVWEEAASAWDAGLRRLAVQSAAARIDRETQVKVRRPDLSGVNLARQAWSADDPQLGRAVLRPVGYGDPGSETYNSALNGSRDFHAGAMARIRNLATHNGEELEEPEALEQLAALSVLARWIEAAEVVEA